MITTSKLYFLDFYLYRDTLQVFTATMEGNVMRVFNSQFANIDLVKGKQRNGAKVTWISFAKENQYLEVMKMVIRLFTEYKLDYLILNQTNMKAVTPNVIDWIDTDFAAPLSKGIKKVIIKKSKDIFGSFSTDSIIDILKKNGLEISVHEELETFNQELESLFAA